MRIYQTILILIILLSGIVLYAVNIRHDVDDQRYIEFAKAAYLRPGLVITRPGAPVPGSGVLIHQRYIITAGHIGSHDGPAEMPVRFLGREYIIDHVYLFPGYDSKILGSGGNDLSIFRVRGEGITGTEPAKIWAGGIEKGEVFRGVGQGKSGTGKDSNEPLPAGTFRGYENTADLVLGPEHHHMIIADFDGPANSGNSLATDIYFLRKKTGGNSSPVPLQLEGSIAAGDSGSGIWISRGGNHYLAGIATGRYYACYYAQSMYVNLGDPKISTWIQTVIPGIVLHR